MAEGERKQPMYGAESTISASIADPDDLASCIVAIKAIIAALENVGFIETNS